MDAQGTGTAGYVVPTYRAAAGAGFYHFLHGNVPGHQIDFIYRPELPQGPLTQQHFSHLSRLVRYIEPRSRSAFAFAIGNLSRDDTQYEPGRGGIALIFGLRIHGVKDHAGRQDPPFCHALTAIGRHFDESTLFRAAMAFYRKLLPDEESQAEGSGWYHSYVQSAENRDALMALLHAYIADFDDLPALPPSALGFRWTIDGVTPPKRIVITHGDDEPFETIAAASARIAGVLMESDIRWTAISNGRESDVQGGVSIRFVSQRDMGPEEPEVQMLRLQDLPYDPKELAELFGAKEVNTSQAPERPLGWRQLYAEEIDGSGDADRARAALVQSTGDKTPPPAAQVAQETQQQAPRRPAGQVGILVGIGIVLAIGGAVAALVTSAAQSPAEPAPGSNGALPDTGKTAAVQPAPSASDFGRSAVDPRVDAGIAPNGGSQVRPQPTTEVPMKALPGRPPSQTGRFPPPFKRPPSILE